MSLPPVKAGRVNCVVKVLLVFLHRSPLGLVKPPPRFANRKKKDETGP